MPGSSKALLHRVLLIVKPLNADYEVFPREREVVIRPIFSWEGPKARHGDVVGPNSAAWPSEFGRRCCRCRTAEPGGTVYGGDVNDLWSLASHAVGVVVERA